MVKVAQIPFMSHASFSILRIDGGFKHLYASAENDLWKQKLPGN